MSSGKCFGILIEVSGGRSAEIAVIAEIGKAKRTFTTEARRREKQFGVEAAEGSKVLKPTPNWDDCDGVEWVTGGRIARHRRDLKSKIIGLMKGGSLIAEIGRAIAYR